MGVGYVKRVFPAKVDNTGRLPLDQNGDPIFEADESKAMIH